MALVPKDLGSSAVAVNDLETVAGKPFLYILCQLKPIDHAYRTVGSYDDNILKKIDQLAAEAHARDIKLVIAMHDRSDIRFLQQSLHVYTTNFK